MFQQFGGGVSPDMDLKSILPDEMFSERAETRVRLGLLVSELVQTWASVLNQTKCVS